jgi:hypothetical protein
MRNFTTQLIVFSAICSAIMLSACEKLEELTTFTLNQSTTFTVPSSTGLNLPFNFPTPNVQTSNTQEFEQNNTAVNLVQNVRLTTLQLRILSPDGQGFGFIRSLKIYIDADGVQESLIAEITDIPTNAGSELSLETTGANLDAYIKAGRYRLRNEVTTRQIVGSDVEIRASMAFQVTAKLRN